MTLTDRADSIDLLRNNVLANTTPASTSSLFTCPPSNTIQVLAFDWYITHVLIKGMT